MLSSTIEEIKQDTRDVAGDIGQRTLEATSDIAAEAGAAAEHAGDRIAREGIEIKSEIELLLDKVHDLLSPVTHPELRRQIGDTVDEFASKVRAWGEGKQEDLALSLGAAKVRSTRTLARRPMTTMLVAAGAGALVAYWLAHRAGDAEQMH